MSRKPLVNATLKHILHSSEACAIVKTDTDYTVVDSSCVKKICLIFALTQFVELLIIVRVIGYIKLIQTIVVMCYAASDRLQV
jgi:hypothetical protein